MSRPPVEPNDGHETVERADAPSPAVERPGRRWSAIVLPVVWLVLGLAGGVAIIAVVQDDEAPPPTQAEASASPSPKKSRQGEKDTEKAAEPEASTRPTSEPTTEATTEAPVSRSVAVSVFNQIGIGGLAARVAGQAQTAGWPIGAVSDWRGSVPQDTIYFPPGAQREAELLGSDLGIGRIMPAVANMSGTNLTVVLASPR